MKTRSLRFGISWLCVSVVTCTNVATASAATADLCRFLIALGGITAPIEDIQAYLAPAAQLVRVESLPPVLREKLRLAALAMLSLPAETDGQRTFAGESWGDMGVGHLWLLGQTAPQIGSQVRPFLETYFRERIQPGLQLLERQQDFRTPVAEPARGSGILGGDADFQGELRKHRDQTQIDSAFSETTPAIVGDFVRGALLSGNRDLAEKAVRYMFLLDPEDTATIYALEALGEQKALLSLGQRLFHEAEADIQKKQLSFKLRNRFAAAIEALARVTATQLKPEANAVLLAIARAVCERELHEQLEATAESEGDKADAHTEYFDLAFEAIESMAPILRREFIDSQKVRLIHGPLETSVELRQFVTHLAELYMQFDHRTGPDQYAPLRSALQVLGETKTLRECGDKAFASRHSTAEDWWKTNAHYSAAEFYLAAGDKRAAQAVLAQVLQDFTFEPSFNRQNRMTIAADDMKSLAALAVAANDSVTMNHLVQVAEDNDWEKTTEDLAAIAAGEYSVEMPTRFPRRTDFPEGLTGALGDWERTELLLSQATQDDDDSEGQQTRETAIAALRDGDVDTAFTIFSKLRDVPGLIAVGDAYLELHHRRSGGGGRHFGASAHSAYLHAALLQLR